MTDRCILLAGPFGLRNPGDEALLEAFALALPAWEVVPTPGASDPADVAKRVRAADAVVFGGGTVFKALRPDCGRPPLDLLSRAAALAMGAKAMGKPLALVGVGAGSLPGRRGRMLARRLVHSADLLVLRDEESADLLAEAGAPSPFRVGADPAWTVLGRGELVAPRLDRDGPLVVALSAEAGGDDLPDLLAAALVPVLARGTEVVLQPWQVGGPNRIDDLDLARAVQRRLAGTATLVVPPADLHEAVRTFRGAAAVFALRFHALPAAAVAGVPTVALAHEAKLAGLARRLHQPALTLDASPEALGRALVAAVAAGEPPSGAAVRGELAAAEEGFRLLRLLLTGGASFEDAAAIGHLPLRPEEWSA